jgi:hypothetical protein
VICVITAHNPGGQTVSDEANAEEQERLERKLNERGWTWWRAAGGDPSWEHVEASAAVVGAEESEVVTLGAEFGQDAIFVLTLAGRSVVGCLSAREIVTGWSVSAEQPAEPTETMAQERPAVPVTPAMAAETGDEDQDEDIDEDENDDTGYTSLSPSAKRIS